jgi:ribosomal protein L27
VKAGEVIVRQRGLPYHPGVNVKRAGDDTLYAMVTGLVHFRFKKVREFTGRLVNRRFVDVIAAAELKKAK